MESSNTPVTNDEACTPSAVAKHKRPRWIIVSPEVGSLYDILHDYAGVSLYVLPICWTDLHAQLLGCRFIQLPPFTCPTPPPSSPSPSSPRVRYSVEPPTVISVSQDLYVLMSPDETHMSKNHAMHSIISTFYPESVLKERYYVELGLRFGGRIYHNAVRCHLLWERANVSHLANHRVGSTVPGAPDESSLLVYISRTHIDYVRRNGFRILNGPKGVSNLPVRRLQALRSKSLLPKNPNEDSYFLAAMVAMAQKSSYENFEKGTGFYPRPIRVRVLTVAEDESSFVVYTAVIPPALLSMFDKPDLAADGDAAITIEYAQVPIWPILGLKERLGRALGEALVGCFDGVPIDNFESELDRIPVRSYSTKRRRAIFAEVYNKSFSEDREPKKKQCTEDHRVGVVR